LQHPVWDILWKLQVPSKIKIFDWKALHGLIPGMGVLANIHIKVPGQCPICKQGAEDIRQFMFTCKPVKEVCSALGLEGVIDNAIRMDRSDSVIFEEI
jgi:hypothetical protein